MKKKYYQDIFTDKSWQILLKLKQKAEFKLIGGWAVYLYTNALKSKDIDIITDYNQLDFLKNEFEIHKNDRLKKYEVKLQGIDIDIYLPFYSSLGLPVEELMKYTEKTETFTVLKKELLILTKLYAYQSRRSTVKGQKDAIDIFALIFLSDFDFKFFKEMIKKYDQEQSGEELKSLLVQAKQVSELDLNPHFYRKERERVLKNL